MVGGIKGIYPDTAEVETGPIELSDQWEQYSINLTGKDLTYISGGFGWVTSANANPKGMGFYLDNIKFEYDPNLKPQVKAAQNMPFYVYADSTSVGNHFIPSGWMGDYGDIALDQASTGDPYLGDNCIKIVYSGKIPKVRVGLAYTGSILQTTGARLMPAMILQRPPSLPSGQKAPPVKNVLKNLRLAVLPANILTVIQLVLVRYY